jgi:hypothetical protein
VNLPATTAQCGEITPHRLELILTIEEELQRNKDNIMAFCDLMFNQCQAAEAIVRYAGDTYIQHNPHVWFSLAIRSISVAIV